MASVLSLRQRADVVPTPSNVLTRLHQLRAAIFNPKPATNPSESAPAAPHALLLVGGVDGKFNAGSRRALAFLLEGTCRLAADAEHGLQPHSRAYCLLLPTIAAGAVGDEVSSLTQTDDSLTDDMFALITPDHAFICCNTITFESIKHLILCWPGLHLTVTAPPTPADPDAGEDQKAAAFIHAGCGRWSTRRSWVVV